MSDESTAVEALEQLGLTEYEARCFVALTRISEGTAREVSQLSTVPRSRVYDTVERLHQRGLVNVQQSDPRKYQVVPADEALDRLRRDYSSNIEAADAALKEIKSARKQEKEGTWAIADAENVIDRIIALLDNAEEQVHLIVADETRLEDDVLDRLTAATDRGVTVIVEVPSESTQNRIQQTAPAARVVVSTDLRDAEKVVEKWPGQLLIVDRQAVLASGVEESDLPEVEQETAVWSHGRDHGFAAWIRELLRDRVDEVDSTE